MPENLGDGVYWVDERDREGVVNREAGSCVRTADLEAHRTDCKKAARIMLKVVEVISKVISNWVRCEGSLVQ